MSGPAFLFRGLADVAAEAPDAPALVFPGSSLSRSDVLQRVATIAGRLVDAGLPVGAPVGITLTDETDHLLVTMALLCLGTPSLNLPTHESLATRAAMARRAGIKLVVTAPGCAVPEETEALVPSLAAPFRPDPDMPDRLGAIAAQPSDQVLLRTTSGTTGVPKTFGVTLELILNAVARMRGNPAEACVLRCSSVEHDSSRIYRVQGLLAGNRGAFLDRITSERLGPFCAEVGVTEIHCGTYKLASLLSAPPSDSERLPVGTRILTGGSRVPGALRDAVRARLTRDLWISYATSEVGVIAWAGPDDHAPWPEGIGRPETGVEISLRDATGAEVPRSEVGTVWVRKAGASPGPDGQPQWHCTGDLLSWPQDGPLLFHGRSDDLMILNGINIFPGAIEDVLERHPAVAEAVAYPLPSPVHGQIPVAAVVLRDGAAADPADLLRHARDHLGIRGPRRITVVAAIPRTVLGKPLRRLLAAGVSDPSR